MSSSLECRLCGRPFDGSPEETFVDLGMSPVSPQYLTIDQLDQPEVFQPLHVRVCPDCLLVQLPAYPPHGAGTAMDTLESAADLRGFAAQLAERTNPDGVVTVEFGHLLSLVSKRQYDAIGPAQRSYFSLFTASRALAGAGLAVTDVAELADPRGLLRAYARPAPAPAGESVEQVLALERLAGLHGLGGHIGFDGVVVELRRALLEFLFNARAEGRTVVGYGAPASANTLLSHCGIRPDLMAYTVDDSPIRQGKYLPGSRIPIYPPERIEADRPDYVVVLPWEMRPQVTQQLAFVRHWGGRLVFPIPSLQFENFGVYTRSTRIITIDALA